MSQPDGTPCWIELVTPDRDRAVAFYGALFGWTATDPVEEFAGYSQWMAGERPIGGLMPSIPELTGAPGWAVYLATDDVRKVAESAVAHGGSVAVAPMDLPGLGSSVVVADPSGMGHCAWQAGPFAGTEAIDTVGDPIWHEAYTTDFAASRAFLESVFGWRTTLTGDTDEFRYAVNGPEESATAGLMDAATWGPDFVPSWTVYVKVADMEACVTQVVALGGAIVEGPDDTPYGLLTTIADPNGQQIKVMVPPAG
ncbi:VOC family protein [Nocardioides sambongensis]|uniref:VOC family protein n=1 Tax=Nocardioides sambongensis TaxID=2589074 RepID=UPI001127EC97|nr:VOC family protein [Nocardioides sambongensis]